jgi:hypothetical protein
MTFPASRLLAQAGLEGRGGGMDPSLLAQEWRGPARRLLRPLVRFRREGVFRDAGRQPRRWAARARAAGASART